MSAHDLARGPAQAGADPIQEQEENHLALTDKTKASWRSSTIEPANNCQRCEAHHRRAEAIRVDLENAETELRVARRRETALRNELRKHLEDDPANAAVKEVLAEWKIVCNHQRAKTPLDGARAKAVRRMLKAGYTADQLKKAILGCGRFPYVGPQGRVSSGDTKTRHDDLTLILRDESTVERFIGYADRDDKPDSEKVVQLQSIRGGGERNRNVVGRELLDDAVEQIITLRRVIAVQQDMIAMEANLNDRLLHELDRTEAAVA